MKKFGIVIVILLGLVLPLEARSLGYSVGFYGQSGFADENQASSGVELSLVYQPWSRPIANPSVFVRGSFGTDMAGLFVVPYYEMGVSVDVFRTINHPFNFLANNIVAFNPAVSLAYHWKPGQEGHYVSFGISPFKISEKDFWYEFFSPFVSLDLDTRTVDSWGINLVRYTYLYK